MLPAARERGHRLMCYVKNQDFLKFLLLFSLREAIINTVKLGSKEVFPLLAPQIAYSVVYFYINKGMRSIWARCSEKLRMV